MNIFRLNNRAFPWFMLSVAIITGAIGIAALIDLMFHMGWGYTEKDLAMAPIVLAGVAIVYVIGRKVLTIFS